MSATLVANIFAPTIHNFRDDLESSLWVLMWLFLMYSPCTNKEQAALFFNSTLDPQSKSLMGGYSKVDRLKGSTFSTKVSFEGWPALDKLIWQLAHLFASHYEMSLTADDKKSLEYMREIQLNNPQLFTKLKLYNHLIWSHSLCLASLASHKATIEIFSLTVEDPDGWGAPDPAIKQNLRGDRPSPTPSTKSDWTTTLIIDAVEGDGPLSSNQSADGMIPKSGCTDSEQSESSTNGNLTMGGSP